MIVQHGLEFTADDGELFAVPDAQLKADALKQDVLPRLRILLQMALAKVHAIYGVDPMENCTLASSPAFRPGKRAGQVAHHYTAAEQGLTGTRAMVWKGLQRTDGESAKIFPFRYTFHLDHSGVRTGIHLWFQQYTPATNRRFGQFLMQEMDVVQQILRIAEADLIPYHVDVLSLKEDMELLMSNGSTPDLRGRPMPYPLGEREVLQLVNRFVVLYPIYDSYVRIALNVKPRFRALIEKLETYLSEHADEWILSNKVAWVTAQTPELASVMLKAEQRVSAPKGIRWRVFSRDGWCCRSCNRSSLKHGVILHVDHIIPRSKGGADVLDNYQTLCADCNLGKSNRDRTDLRVGATGRT